MKRLIASSLIGFSSVVLTHGQPIITADDLFNQAGQYYRAYANQYNATDITGGTAYVVPPDLIGDPGPDKFWDFSKGPEEKTFRYDYISPTGVAEAADFPDAKIVERKTDEADQSKEFLFFTQVPGTGRRVYGYYAVNPVFTPSNVFTPPIVDFPDRISYGQEWSTSTTYENTTGVPDTDPDPDLELSVSATFDIRTQVTTSSTFKVDAHGTIVPPDGLGGFGPGLRVNEDVTIDVSADLGDGTWQHLETDYTRNYYWLMPGLGIVAQLSSTQNASPAPAKFPRATAFVRMFETNKKPVTGGGGCTAPAPVTDLKIRVSNGIILLTWTKVECAGQYQVQYSTEGPATGWTPLGAATANAFWQGENTATGPMRFYRVVSLK